MPKWIIAMPLLILIACNSKKENVLTPKQQLAKVDSIVREQQRWIKEQEKERLRDRMSIEVKEKTDSILAKYKAQSTPVVASPQPDTVAKQNEISSQPDTIQR